MGALVVLASLTPAACGVAPSPPSGGPAPVGAAVLSAPDPAEGAAILERACTVCHGLGGLAAYSAYWGEPEWRSMVETMMGYGAALSPAEVDVLARYLAVSYGTGGTGPKR